MRYGPNTVYEMSTATLEYVMFPELKSTQHSYLLFVYFSLLWGGQKLMQLFSPASYFWRRGFSVNLELTVSMQKHNCYLKRERRDFILESDMSGLTWEHSFSLLQIPCSNVEFFFSFIEQSKDGHELRHFKCWWRQQRGSVQPSGAILAVNCRYYLPSPCPFSPC